MSLFESSCEKKLNWRPMTGRSPHEHHRVSTTLELLFDLIFVVAISFAAAQLHHTISAGHAAHGVVSFIMVFFAIWWAWMGFTWFASSFDTDDVPYRIAVFVQMVGALVIAAGIPKAFNDTNFLMVTIGYGIMRVATIAQWLRAARESTTAKVTARRYALGITLTQLGWILLLFVPHSVWLVCYVLMLLAEFAVPMWAEKAGLSPWHPHHISERYGLLTIIVLGESILACANATQEGLSAGLLSVKFVLFCLGALLTVFCMWWLYFEDEAAEQLTDYKTAFFWGYGHFFIFASAAAGGAGLAAQVDFMMGHAEASMMAVSYGLAIPIAVFVFFTWWVHKRVSRSAGAWVYPLAALFILLTPWLVGYTTISIATILVIALIIHSMLTQVKVDKP